VNGRARVVDDPSLLAAAELNGRAPKSALKFRSARYSCIARSVEAFETVGPVATRRQRVLPLAGRSRRLTPRPFAEVPRLLEPLHHQAELGRRKRFDVRRRRNSPIESENADSTIFPAPKGQLTAPTPRLALTETFAPITERLLLWRNRRLKPKTAFSLLARS
jgi:hypothetical protein